MPVIAHKTLNAIDDAIYADQGASFREHLAAVMPKMEDAYRGSSDRHRSHFGFSSAGDKCARKLWFSFLWVKPSIFPARIQRLFNRGHLEEARFIALLQSAGFAVHYETKTGGQFKISDHSGHAGSAIDAVTMGIPDIPDGQPALTEMKTHNKKQFTKLLKLGVKESHHKHYIQMQIYMRKYKLKWGLYLAVQKDDDELYAEIIELNESVADGYIARSGSIIYAVDAPERISTTAAWWECKFCDYKEHCHGNAVPEVNCRTCIHSGPVSDKRWHCSFHNKVLSKEKQLSQDCADHIFKPSLLNGATLLNSDPEEGWIKIAWREQVITLGNKDKVQRTTSEGLAKGDYV